MGIAPLTSAGTGKGSLTQMRAMVKGSGGKASVLSIQRSLSEAQPGKMSRFMRSQVASKSLRLDVKG
jgi:hypothetical protein